MLLLVDTQYVWKKGFSDYKRLPVKRIEAQNVGVKTTPGVHTDMYYTRLLFGVRTTPGLLLLPSDTSSRH